MAPPDDAFGSIPRLCDSNAGSIEFDGPPLASFVGHLASLGIARDCFKRPALI